MKRVATVITTILASVLILSACAPAAAPTPTPAAKATTAPAGTAAANAASGAPIKVAAVLSRTGTFGSLGSDIAKALELEVDRVNATGGVNGRPIQLISYDDQSKPDEAIALLKKAVREDKVVALVGPAPSVMVNPALAVIRELKVPTFGIGSVVITPEDKYFFSHVSPLETTMAVYFNFMKKKGLTKIAVLNPNDDLSNRASQLIDKLAPQYGMTVVGQERMAQTDTDVTPQLIKLKALNPDVLISWGTGDPAVLVYKNAQQIGLTAPIIFNSAVATSTWFKLAGDIPKEGTLYVQGSKLQNADYLPESDPLKKEAIAFREAYQAKYNLTAENVTSEGYDIVHELVSAFKAVGTDPEKLRSYLETVKYCGLSYCFNRTPNDHVGIDPDSIYMMTAKGNAWIPAK